MDENNFKIFFTLIEKLKTVTRHSWTSDISRKESVAEHSWMLSLLALISLHQLKNKTLDPLKILKLAIIHDFAEAIAGDIPTHEQDGSNKKHLSEQDAKQKIISHLPSNIAKELDDLWEEYEAQTTDESKIVKALDKIEVGFQHNVANLATWDDGDKSYPINYAEKPAKVDPFLTELNQFNMNWRRQKLSL